MKPTCYAVDKDLADPCWYLVVAISIDDARKHGTVLFELPDEAARKLGVDLTVGGIQGRLRAEITQGNQQPSSAN